MATQKVTALVGAGITFELTNASEATTEKLTEAISRNIPLKCIKNILKENWGNINFEHIMHILEQISSYNTQIKNSLNSSKTDNPLIANFNKFITYKPEYKCLFEDNETLLHIDNLVKTIAEKIHEYDCDFPSLQNDWYRNFWNVSKKQLIWNITTTNYDTTLEQTFGRTKYNDGFKRVKNKKYSRFSPTDFLKRSNMPIIGHLHGCINYGNLPSNDLNNFIDEDTLEDFYQYDNYEKARANWIPKSPNVIQANENVIVGPIITGMRKTEKILPHPYSWYHYNFQKSILENSSLLIVGYGFGDSYLNQTMERINQIHGDKKRIVVITYAQSAREIARLADGTINHDAFSFYCKAFKATTNPLLRFSNDDFFNSKKVIKSDNGNVLVYVHGFREASENHTDEIINFLNEN